MKRISFYLSKKQAIAPSPSCSGSPLVRGHRGSGRLNMDALPLCSIDDWQDKHNNHDGGGGRQSLYVAD